METKVWIRKRQCKPRRGRAVTSYHLRWICPQERCWKSRRVGTDSKRAIAMAAKLEDELADGTYVNIKRITWAAFVADHATKLRARGERNAIESECALVEFGDLMKPATPMDVTYTMAERYIAKLKAKKRPNQPSTVNKKRTYIKGAMTKAIRRGYVAKNPIVRDLWEPVETKLVREITSTEEAAILKSADDLYGLRWRSLVFVAVNVGARRGELVKLSWDVVDLDGAMIRFEKTKTHKARAVPVNPDVVAVLRTLKAQTMTVGGPFVGMGGSLTPQWTRITKAAGVRGVVFHDLRRTHITRLLRRGVPVNQVMDLVGHTNPTTTLKYYAAVSRDDLRGAVAKLTQAG